MRECIWIKVPFCQRNNNNKKEKKRENLKPEGISAEARKKETLRERTSSNALGYCHFFLLPTEMADFETLIDMTLKVKTEENFEIKREVENFDDEETQRDIALLEENLDSGISPFWFHEFFFQYTYVNFDSTSFVFQILMTMTMMNLMNPKPITKQNIWRKK